MQTKKDDIPSKSWCITEICFFSERTHISNIYVQLPFAKIIFRSKGCFHFMLEWCPFLILSRKNTINLQWIISTTQPQFSRQSTSVRNFTGSWCYQGRNDRHTNMRYKKLIESKEGTDWYQGNRKGSRSGRGYKMYQPHWS